MGPATSREIADARDARLELVIVDGEVPEGVRVDLKLDTGMGRWGPGRAAGAGARVVGLMSHFASADSDAAYTELQVERFAAATAEYRVPDAPHCQQRRRSRAIPRPASTRPAAGSRSTGSRPSAPTPPRTGWSRRCAGESQLAQVRQVQPGESTGYGRRWVAERPTWIGIVPVGYADGFRRDLTGTRGARRR